MKKRYLALIVFAVLVVIVLAAGIFGMPILEEKLEKALVNEFSEQTSESYALDLSGIDISILDRSIRVDSLIISPDQDSTDFREITAEYITIDGIHWRSLIKQRFPVFEEVVVYKPNAELFSKKISSAGGASSKLSGQDLQLSTFDVAIIDGKGKVVETTGKTVFSMDEFDLNASEVNLNSLLLGGNVPYLMDLSLTGKGLYWNLEEKLYSFTIDQFSFNKQSEEASIMNLALKPVVEKYRFAEIKGQQLDRFDLEVGKIYMDGLDLDSLRVPAIDIQKVTVTDADLEVFHDKHMPSGTSIQYKPLLHKALGAIGFSLGVDAIKVEDSIIEYGEHRPGADDPGYISFNALNAELTNIRTHEHPLFDEDSLYMHATTQFMDATTMEVYMSYAIFDDKETHRLKALVGQMPAGTLNPVLVNLAFMRIDEGILNAMDLDMLLDRDGATGDLKLDYEGLKVTFLDEEDNENTNLKTRLKSFITNKVVLNSSNTGENLKATEIDFERPKDKAIFGYWWNALRDGLQSTIK
jgi:hypothetical protein